MAGEDKTAAAEIDYEKLAGALAKANKPLLDALDKLAATPAATPAPAAAAEKKDEAAKPLTAADVAKIVADTMGTARASDQAAAARQATIETKLKDLPAAYRNQLGNDPAKWQAEEQAIRDAYKADFKAAGGADQTKDVGGNNGGAGAAKPAQTLDLSKLTPTQLIAQGLRNSRAAGGQPQQATPAAAAAAATATTA